MEHPIRKVTISGATRQPRTIAILMSETLHKLLANVKTGLFFAMQIGLMSGLLIAGLAFIQASPGCAILPALHPGIFIRFHPCACIRSKVADVAGG